MSSEYKNNSSVDIEDGGRSMNRGVTPGGHTLDTSQPAFPVYHRKFGDPAPLGLCAFALPTFVLSLINIGAAGVKTPAIVAGIAFGYGGIGQVLAGMWEFASGNTLGACIFTSYGGFWISFGLITFPWSGIQAAYTSVPELEHALGFYVMGWGIFTFIILLASLRSSIALVALLVVLEVVFFSLGASYFYTGAYQIALVKVAGWSGLVLAFQAWYVAAAGLISPSIFTVPIGSLVKED